MLSTRPDLLPPAFIKELATLQDNVPPLTQEEVVHVMEQELGVPWEDVFESIVPEPMAAGTIAEVHRATLTGGERVVVKVQRPTARKDIMGDLGLLKLFAEKTADRPAFRQLVDMPAIFEHLSESLQRELDFRREAANIATGSEVTFATRSSIASVDTSYSLRSSKRCSMSSTSLESFGSVPIGISSSPAAMLHRSSSCHASPGIAFGDER